MSTQPAPVSPPQIPALPSAGSLGPIPFSLTRPVTSASHTHGQAWVEHEVAGGKSVPEHTGEPLDRIELGLRLWAEALLPRFPPPNVPPGAEPFGGRFPDGTPAAVIRAALAVQDAAIGAVVGRIVPPVAGAFVGERARAEVRRRLGVTGRQPVGGHAEVPDLTGYDVAEDLDALEGMARSALGYGLFLGARFMGRYAITQITTDHVYVHPGHGGLLVADVRLTLLETPAPAPYDDPAAPPASATPPDPAPATP